MMERKRKRERGERREERREEKEEAVYVYESTGVE
jgi:hypothetical protein